MTDKNRGVSEEGLLSRLSFFVVESFSSLSQKIRQLRKQPSQAPLPSAAGLSEVIYLERSGMTKRKKTDLIVVHCAATRPEMDIGVAEIDRWHRERGFDMIGYHDVIRRDGSVEQGRDIDAVGAHVKGHNSHSVGVCMAGGVDKKNRPQNNFTDAQFKSLSRLLKFYKVKYPKAMIVGHTDLDHSKACPSFDVREWLAQSGVS